MNRWTWRTRGLQVVAACVLWCSIGVGQQQERRSIDGIYLGTLGKQEIVLEIGAAVRESAGSPTMPHFVGRYFYRRYGVAIMIEGDPLPDGSISVREYQGEKKTGAQWRITFHDDKATGIFCKCDVNRETGSNKTANIVLTRVSKGFDQDMNWKGPRGQEDSVYYDLLLDFPLQVGPEVFVAKDMAYQVQSDPRFKVGMPRLTRFPDAVVMARVNDDLARTLNKQRPWVAECVVGQELGGSYEERLEITVFTRRVFSVVKDEMYFCGGAHPDGETITRVYDMNTGESVSIYGLLQDEIDPQRVKKLANQGDLLRSLLSDLYRRHFVLPAGLKAEDCDAVLPAGKDTQVSNTVMTQTTDLILVLKKEGLAINPVLSHAYQGCGPEVTVPYREILPLVKRDSRFRSMVESIQ